MAILIRFLLLMLALPAFAQPAGSFIALSYHEVESDSTPISTATAVRASDLGAQFAWLKANGYQPVSVDAIVTARNGGAPLPSKAVLLTFDDGLKNVYTRAFPLLKLFKYPAVIALVGTWLDVPAGGVVDYDSAPKPRDQFVSWDEVREMQSSGLIEVATHAYNLHQGVPANPQGNTEPAAITRRYLSGNYESDEVYLARIREDLAASRQLIARQTGKAPRVLVWPYGRSNLAGQTIARELGMSIAFTLEDGPTTATTPLIQTRRYLIENSPSLQSFAELMRRSWEPDPFRSVKIAPSRWQDDEPALSAALDRLLALQPSVVFLSPNTVQEGLDKAFFSTGHRPLARDSLNHIGWQIERRSGVPVFIDLPVDWLTDDELIADLARQVNFAGIRLSAEPGSSLARQVRASAELWRWPIRLAYTLATSPAEAVWASLDKNDLVVLPADADISGLPANAKSRVLLEFDPKQSSVDIARRMRQLEANGFRQFGLAGPPESSSAEINQVLSLRSQPQLK